MRIFSLTQFIVTAVTLTFSYLISCSALAQEGRPNLTQSAATDNSNGPLDALSQALETFGLAVNGQGPFAWERSEIAEDGSIVYHGFTTSRQRRGKEFLIETVELRGADMQNGEAVFSRVKLSGIKISDKDADLKIRSMTLSKPSAAMFTALGAALREDNDYKFSLDGMGFSALSLYGAAVTVKTHDGDISGKLRSLILSGVNDKEARSMTLSGLTVNGPLDNGSPFDVSLGRFEAKGLNTGKYINLITALKDAEDSGAPLDMATLGYDPYALDYDRIAFKDFSGSLDGVSLVMPSLAADVSEQGEMVIVTQTLAPMTLSAKDRADGGGKASQKLSEILQQNGYNALTFSSRSVTFMDSNSDWISSESRLSLKEGFDLSLRIDINGVGAFAKTVIAAGGELDAAALDTLNIQSVDMTFTDQGFTEKALNFAAKEQDITPETLRSNLVAMLTLASNSQLKGQSKTQGRQIVKTLGRFIEDPNVIQFGILPLDGTVLSEMAAAMVSGDISNLGFYALAD